jgi:hypothetical protein
VLDFVENAMEIEVIELVPAELRTSFAQTGVVTCDFKLLDISHSHKLRDEIASAPRPSC